MNGFTYHNIFDTKGIEYLAIIAFFLLLIPFWLILNRRPGKLRVSGRNRGVLDPSRIRVPAGYYHSNFHTWSFLERTGLARIGADDLLMHLVGKVTFHHLKTAGDRILKGEAIAEMEQDGKKLLILSPVSGEVVSVNQLAKEQPAVLHEDAYGEGWMYSVKPRAWIEETRSFHLADDAKDWITKELERFRGFISTATLVPGSGQLSMVMQDGGELRDQPLSECPEEVWKEFQTQFIGNAVISPDELPCSE